MVDAAVGGLGGRVVARSLAGDKVVCELPAHHTVGDVLAAGLDAVLDFADLAPLDGEVQATAAARRGRRGRGGAARRRRQPANVSASPANCLKDQVTPPCIRKAYGINDTEGSNATNGQVRA